MTSSGRFEVFVDANRRCKSDSGLVVHLCQNAAFPNRRAPIRSAIVKIDLFSPLRRLIDLNYDPNVYMTPCSSFNKDNWKNDLGWCLSIRLVTVLEHQSSEISPPAPAGASGNPHPGDSIERRRTACLESWHSLHYWPKLQRISLATKMTYTFLSLSIRRLSALRIPTTSTRTFSFTSVNHSSPFNTGPAPPRLPKEDQEIFEQLQRQSTGAFSTPRTPPKVNQPGEAAAHATSSASNQSDKQTTIHEGEELHPDLRQGVKPEFEGEVNPKTGEVGGPKNEPLRWGAAGDWSYNGRVTDF